MNANHIIADRAEFIDALAALRRGHVLVRTGDSSVGCVLAGAFVHNVFPTATSQTGPMNTGAAAGSGNGCWSG